MNGTKLGHVVRQKWRGSVARRIGAKMVLPKPNPNDNRHGGHIIAKILKANQIKSIFCLSGTGPKSFPYHKNHHKNVNIHVITWSHQIFDPMTGGHVSPIFTGCEEEGIQVIDTRNEANAVFAADAAARLSGKVGVAVVTAGPGVTNTGNGLNHFWSIFFDKFHLKTSDELISLL